MALVICPECGKEVSQYTNSCPSCGFNVCDFIEKNNLEDTDKKFICPKCGFCNGWDDGIDDYIYLKCKYCNSIMINSGETRDEMVDNFIKNSAYGDYRKTLAMKIGGTKFSEQAFQERENIINHKPSQVASSSPSTQTQPHCPVCNSSNIEKISVGKKIKGSMLFGLFSNDAKKQMVCKDCGYKF